MMKYPHYLQHDLQLPNKMWQAMHM